jgi:hypothetical protein
MPDKAQRQPSEAPAVTRTPHLTSFHRFVAPSVLRFIPSVSGRQHKAEKLPNQGPILSQVSVILLPCQLVSSIVSGSHAPFARNYLHQHIDGVRADEPLRALHEFCIQVLAILGLMFVSKARTKITNGLETAAPVRHC